MAVAVAKADLPVPPGFEDYHADDKVDEAELEEVRRFICGDFEAVQTAAEKDQRPYTRGLVGEQDSTVEIVPWRASQVDESGKGEKVVDEVSNLIDMNASFEDLGLSEQLLRGVYEMGFVKPSKIQAAALPIIIPKNGLGQNMIAQAQNGSGKTATFALALLAMLDVAVLRPQALCICPTRELARQNEAVIRQLGQFLPVQTCLVLAQERIPRNPRSHVLIGTPGMLKDLVQKRALDVSGVKVFVLDEADMMLDQENQMGPQVTLVRQFLPNEVQVLFFSATYPDDVRLFAENLVPRANSIKVKKTELTVSTVAQTHMRCSGDQDKFEKLSELYGAMNVGQSIVFVNARRKAFNIAKWMREAGHPVSLICGTQVQGEERMDPTLRDQVMDEFRCGITRVLIATDVLSRGIDVPQVTLVVNYELPVNYIEHGANMETYLHRVGRTGRFGLRGLAVNLVTDSELPLVDEICKYFDCSIPELDSDFEALEERLRCIR